jgi:hypothetical protein
MSIRTITVNGRGYNTTQAEISVVVNDVAIYSGPVWTNTFNDGPLFQFDVTVDDLNLEQTLAITNENWQTTLAKQQTIVITPTVGDLIVGGLMSPMLAPNDTTVIYDPLNFVWAPPAPSTNEDPTYDATVNDVAVMVDRTTGSIGEWHYQVTQNSTLKFSFYVANRFTTPT